MPSDAMNQSLELTPRRALASSRLVAQEQLDLQHYHPGDFWLGRTLNGRPFGWHEDMNLLTCAGPRTGKGVGIVVPNLLLYDGSAIVIDPKGELASMTAEYRQKVLGQKIVVLDPAGSADVPDELRGTYNPMAHLDVDNPRLVQDAHSLASGIVVPKPDAKEPFWDDTALNFIQTIALYMAIYTEPEQRTLMKLRQMASVGDMDLYQRIAARAREKNPDVQTRPEQSFQFMLDDMFLCEDLEGIIREGAGKLLDMSDNTRGNVLAGARTHLDFLNEPTLWDVLRTATDPDRTFTLPDLRNQEQFTTVYLCLPVDMMHVQGRWLRLIITQIMRYIERTSFNKDTQRPLLMMIDEFYQLGRLPSIVNSLTYAPGFGLRLWLIIQDLGQLKALYPNEWTTIMGACGIQQFFGINELETAKYISEMLGEEEVEVPSISLARSASVTTGTNRSETEGTSDSVMVGSNWSRSTGTSSSQTDGVTTSVTRGTNEGVSRTAGSSVGGSHAVNSGWNSGVSHSESRNVGPGGRSPNRNVTDGVSTGVSGGVTDSTNWGTNQSTSRSSGTSLSTSTSHNRSTTFGTTDTSTTGGSSSETAGTSRSSTLGTSESDTDGQTDTLSVSRQLRKLYRPEEVMLAFTKQNLTQLTFIRDQGGMLLFRTPYYADPYFAHLMRLAADE